MRSSPKWLAAGQAVALSLVAASTAAQNVDILEQHLTVDLSSADTTVVQIELLLEATGAVSILSMFEPALPMVSARVDDVPAQTAPHPQYPGQVVNVVYPSPLTPGQQVRVSIHLEGMPTCGSSSVSCQRGPSETFFTFPAPGSAWYHVSLFDSDPYTGSVEVLVPSGHIVVAGQGEPSAVVPMGGNTERWSFDIQQPIELLGMYAGVAQTISSSRGFPVTALYQADSHDVEDVSLAVDVASELLPILGEQYGQLPVDRAHILALPSNVAFGGMGMLGKVFVNGVVFSSHDYLVEQGMAHEFSHSWWGNLASGSAPNESAFLNEGMAEYSAWRALGVARGAAMRVAGMRMNAVWYMLRRPNDEDIPVLSGNDQSPAFIFVTYHKGALALRALEQMVGSDAFGDALKLFVARGQGQLSVAGLVQDIETVSGRDVGAAADQWLWGEGFPRLAINPVVDGGEVRLGIDLEGDYLLELPVRVTMADGSVEEHSFAIGAGVTEPQLSLGERPASIEIDPEWTMAREIVPALAGDVSFDGVVDAADMIEVALRHGGYLPTERRVDGSYDPLYDVDRDQTIGDADLEAVRTAALSY